MQSLFADLPERLEKPLRPDRGVRTNRSILLIYPPERESDFREQLVDAFLPRLETARIPFTRADSTDAVLLQYSGDRDLANALTGARRRQLPPEVDRPWRRDLIVHRVEELRVVAPELLPHPIRQPNEVPGRSPGGRSPEAPGSRWRASRFRSAARNGPSPSGRRRRGSQHESDERQLGLGVVADRVQGRVVREGPQVSFRELGGLVHPVGVQFVAWRHAGDPVGGVGAIELRRLECAVRGLGGVGAWGGRGVGGPIGGDRSRGADGFRGRRRGRCRILESGGEAVLRRRGVVPGVRDVEQGEQQDARGGQYSVCSHDRAPDSPWK